MADVLASSSDDSVLPLLYKMDTTLRNLGYDVPSAVKSGDIRTVGVIGAGIVFGFVLLEILSYILGFTKTVLGGANGSTYSNYGRSLAVTAAKAWENRDKYLDLSSRGRWVYFENK